MSTVDMLNLILYVILAFIVLLGFVAVLLIFKMRNKNKQERKEEIKIQSKEENPNLISRNGKSINSIYKFMEFDQITDNMIARKNRKQYVMIIH